MATYFFSSFTQAQAQAYSAATDTILFNGGETASSVRFTINSLLGNYVMTTTAGVTLNFGSGVLGESDWTFNDGSKVLIGTSAADNMGGGAQGDALFGADGADVLNGAGGNDVLNGGAGADRLVGGTGADTFVFDAGQSLPTAADMVLDWEVSGDRLEFTGLHGKTGLFESMTNFSGTVAEATTFANQEIAAGRADYVAVRILNDTYVFADTRDDNGAPDDLVVLSNAVGGITAANIVGAVDATPVQAPPTGGPVSLIEPTLPAPVTVSGGPTTPFITVSGGFAVAPDLSQVDLVVTQESSTGLSISSSATFGGAPYHPVDLILVGTGFAYDGAGEPIGGTITSLIESITAPVGGALQTVTVNISNIQIGVQQFIALADSPDPNALTNGLYGGNDLGNGGNGNDVLNGLGGTDTLVGQRGSDSVFGGDGNDVIYGASATSAPADAADQNYLRGEAGDDYILGGGGFDDINGNMGNDTASGGIGDDWVVGGKDNDLLFGDTGNDIVWGNLGNDTLVGGDGADQVRGGQGDDVLWGGAGNDFVSGDRGNDTITGGAGADNFHDSQDAGIDRVLDFSLADGDRVMLDPGTTFTVSQVGADTVIDMGGGNQMILVGVQMSTLPAGTIFLG